jgi:hypothetical protein
MRPLASSLLLLLPAFVTAAPAAANSGAALRWIEAENYAVQFGSTAPRFNMTSASGGACVDNNWGAQPDHFLRYSLDLAADFPSLHLTLRYAREMAGDARLSVTLDGRTNSTRLITLPSTGGWGFKPLDWKFAGVALPEAARGHHTLELRSVASQNNVNLDGFYLTAEPVDTDHTASSLPIGPDRIAPLGEGLFSLPCGTPLALPYARRKAFLAGDGRLQVLLGSDQPAGMGGNVAGPALHVLLAGHGPWTNVEQSVINHPVPTVVTRFDWPDVVMEQRAFAAAPEQLGWFLSVTLSNPSPAVCEFEVHSLLQGAPQVERQAGVFSANGRALLRVEPSRDASFSAPAPEPWPGPLAAPPYFQHRLKIGPRATGTFHLQFLGDGRRALAEASAETARFWERQLRDAASIQLPDSKLQYAFDASLRQMLMLIEPRPDHARVLKGLVHYYGANPYDTLQVSRALDSVGLRRDAEELLRHQLAHLKDDGLFEMWETGDLKKPGADQWIVQGLAATALWSHFDLWRDDDWLRDITPALVKAAQATARILDLHAGPHQQGSVPISGWLPPIGGDGGLGVGYHWSQNTGPLAGLRYAAEAARRLNRPEAAPLRAAAENFQTALDAVRQRAVEAAGLNLIPAFPGAVGADRTRPLWGVVMSVTTFGAIPPDDPAALGTLRFLQTNLYVGLHLNLGYSRGTWPYLSAETALWHLQLGEGDVAWRILDAIVNRASSTVCWYEEFDHNPPTGHGDAADVWAAAEAVYLTRQLLLQEHGDELRICPGLPERYMSPGKQIRAGNLPIRGGSCAFTVHFEPDRVSADIRFSPGASPARVRLCLAPPNASPGRTPSVDGVDRFAWDGRDLVLTAPKSRVRLSVP